LAHFAETDEWVSAASVRNLEKSLCKAGRAFEFYTDPDTGHCFFEDDRSDAFEPEAAALAWTRTMDFLKKSMG
jgi:carboxymethylenebutenolidase